MSPRYVHPAAKSILRFPFTNIELLEFNLDSYSSNNSVSNQNVITEEAVLNAIQENFSANRNATNDMNKQIFNVDDWNTYYRYSEDNKKIVKYATKGLVIGENEPALHYNCRSILIPYK